MGFFTRFKAAQEKSFGEDGAMQGKFESSRYINHPGEFLCELVSAKYGKVDNKGSKADKHPFTAFELRVLSIAHQDEDFHVRQNEAEKAEVPVREGELISIFQKLPRTTDPADFTIEEEFQVGELCNLLGAFVEMKGADVDLEEMDELFEDDAAALQGIRVLAIYSDSYSKKHGRHFINPELAPVDQKTGERNILD